MIPVETVSCASGKCGCFLEIERVVTKGVLGKRYWVWKEKKERIAGGKTQAKFKASDTVCREMFPGPFRDFHPGGGVEK